MVGALGAGMPPAETVLVLRTLWCQSVCGAIGEALKRQKKKTQGSTGTHIPRRDMSE